MARHNFEETRLLRIFAVTASQRAPFSVHREKHGTATLGPRADWDEWTVFATTNPLDANHLGSEVGQQCRAKRPCDVTPEIEHANAFEHAGQLPLLPLPQFDIYQVADNPSPIG